MSKELALVESNGLFQRVAIVNRGEPAMRFINAVNEFNQEHKTKICTIALYSEPDQRAMFVRAADEAYFLGSATFQDDQEPQIKNRYLDYQALEKALVETQADAVWVGWGFVAEHAEFADLCDRLGIKFIGPCGNTMRRLGDKISAKQLAEQVNIPVGLWSQGAVDTLEQAIEQAKKIGFPLMIKATVGGGGLGIRKVFKEDELAENFNSAQAEAISSFGNKTVFIEKLLTNVRHIEVPILGDDYGTIWAVGLRDCSVQRHHQKVIEESASTVLTEQQEQMIKEMAIRLAKAVNYRNVGTVEFLYDLDTNSFCFLEVNTRLQVEHPVTEVTTGLDLVKMQLFVACGGKLGKHPPLSLGHAIEVRLNAEDPDNKFVFAPGKIELYRLPTGAGIRIDTGLTEGETIAPEFDPMIAKIIAYGHNRQEAIARLQRALSQSNIIIDGGTTNKAFLLELLSNDDFNRGAINTNWLDNYMASEKAKPKLYSDIALLQASINVYEKEWEVELAQFKTSATRGRLSVRSEIGYQMELGYQGKTYKLTTQRIGIKEYKIDVAGRQVIAQVDPQSDFEKRLTIFDAKNPTKAGQVFRLNSCVNGTNHRIEVNNIAHLVSQDQAGAVRSPSPAVVVSVQVKEGQEVTAGDCLVILEAMKMEMSIVAPFAGKITQVLVNNNVQVGTGVALLYLAPISLSTEVNSGIGAGFEALDKFLTFSTLEKSSLKQRFANNLNNLKRMLLGFDIDSNESKRLLAERVELVKEFSEDDEELRKQEDELIEIYANIQSLFRRQLVQDDSEIDEVLISDAHFISFVRTFDTKLPIIPKIFYSRLEKMVARYGLKTLSFTPALVDSMVWIYKSRQRLDQYTTPILSVLNHRLDQAPQLIQKVGTDFHNLLDKLTRITQNRVTMVNDVAREVHFTYFEEPLFIEAKEKLYQKVKSDLVFLVTHPDATDRHERIQELLDCPLPLVVLFSNLFRESDLGIRQLMLEVLTQRYYRIRPLENLRVIAIEGHSFVLSDYKYEGRRIQLITTFSEFESLKKTAQLMTKLITDLPEDRDLVIDFYTWQDHLLADQEFVQQNVMQTLNEVSFNRPLRRVVVAYCSTSINETRNQYFTYRPVYLEVETSTEVKQVKGYAEEKLYRNLHPMMAKRLHLWRLSNFNIDRLPSVEDVYVFHAIAKENPKDERLFAIAEIRDLSPIRNKKGRIVQLPYLERMLLESLASIRNFQAKRTPQDRLYFNQVLLYLWPVLDLQPDELDSIVHRLAPSTEGLGIERIVVVAKVPNPSIGEIKETFIQVSNPGGKGLVVNFADLPNAPIETLGEYEQKVVRLQQRGMLYPYRLVEILTPAKTDTQSDLPPGDFIEYDLDAENKLVSVNRPYGKNKANIIVGLITNYTAKYPEGMTRVILLGDPSKEMGSLAEAECRRIIEALKLAKEKNLPLEWFALSAGAKISMETGTENMDWISLVLRYIVEFTQQGLEINVIVNGINVGAQPYWNAEATMLMHTKGILVMNPESAMVLTGKQALDYSGSVSAEDNIGIGGYERTMGPNGQAQYFATDINEAISILLQHYDHTYVMKGERFPRRATTTDPFNRDVCNFPHNSHGNEFATVGDIFSDKTNSGRKHPFEIRRVLKAVSDQDHQVLERWSAMKDAETAVVLDAHIGGYPVCLLGFESHPIARKGFIPSDGPEQWTSGTLFPQSSKKIARAVNGASNNRPLVVLANLAGFDGSPESMRKVQLEYGAEIGRAVVNFKGPIVFVVISRYHGGAFVVFSKKLNDSMEVVALEGSYASVIGGAPAAAVVFAREVDQRTKKDLRIVELEAEINKANDLEKRRLRSQLTEVYKLVRSEKLGEVADEFDHIHSVHRALKVGSLDKIIPASSLRSYVIDAIERGINRELNGN